MIDAYKYLWGYSLWRLGFACLLVQLRNEQLLPWLFNQPLLGYLGKISYGLYVFHYPLLWLIKLQFPALAWHWWVIVSLLCTIGLSALSYALFESPLLALKDRYFTKTATPPTAHYRIETAHA